MGRTAAFFDLDGTICSGQSWKGLPEYCLAKEINLRTTLKKEKNEKNEIN